MATPYQLKRGLSADWTAANPVLAEGEIGIEITSTATPPVSAPKIKIGNGITAWNSLPYSGGSSGGATVTFSTTAPTTAIVGDIWIDSNTGIELIYVNDGTSSQWVELNTTGVIQDASATQSGIVNTTTQTFAGNKVFLGTINSSYVYGGRVKLTTSGTTTASGTFTFSTYTVNGASLKAIKVICQGAGGGSGGSATTGASQTAVGMSGSGGSCAETFYTISTLPGTTSFAYRVGGGGTAGAANGSGADGYATCIGIPVTTSVVSNTSGSTSVVVSSISGVVAGQAVYGTNIAPNTTVVSASAGVITLSTGTIGVASGTLTLIGGFGSGNGYPLAMGYGGSGGVTGSAQGVNIGSGNVATSSGFGDLVIPGGGTQQVINATPASRAYSTTGGDSFLGRGGDGLRTLTGFNGVSGYGYGSGASGGANSESQGTARSGAAGAPGIILIDLYY